MSRLLVLIAATVNAMVNSWRSKFLPYGDSFRPLDPALRATLAIEATPSQIRSVKQLALVAGADLVFEATEGILPVLLFRWSGDGSFLNASLEGVRTLEIQAGPFRTRNEVVLLIQLWRSNYWDCHKLETGGASCFEYGGCHKFCWWREKQVAQVSDLKLIGVDDMDSETNCITVAMLNGLPCVAPPCAAAKGDYSRLNLAASIIKIGESLFYCGLQQIQTGPIRH